MKRERSPQAFERARGVTPGGVHSPVRAFGSVGQEPFFVSHGAGPYLYDLDQNRYVDYVLSWGPLVLGHADPAVVEAISNQAAKGTSFGACAEAELELAELVVNSIPSIEMLRFVSSGTEATMSAIRLARAFTERSKIIKFTGCYHGHADCLLIKAGSGVATLGIPGSAGVPEGATRDTLSVPFNDLEGVRELFKRYPQEIAGVILEPVVGNAGLIEPLPRFLAGLREITEQHGALLIFDEVMTGFRVARGGAQALYGITPDLTTLGKVIGGGLPVGAYGGRREIMQLVAPIGPMYQAGTLSGNPLAMVAGTVTLKAWLGEGRFDLAATAAKDLVTVLNQAASSHGVPFTATAVGTMFGFFFSDQKITNYEAALKLNRDTFSKFFAGALERGVYFAPSSFEAGFTSSVHGVETLELTKRAVDEAMGEIASKG